MDQSSHTTGNADRTIAPVEEPRRFAMSPLNRRRLENFKKNRRGYWSLWIFAILFVLTLFAELIANDRPLIVSYKGETLFPVLQNFPEEKFGGFLAITDYRDPFIQDEITPGAAENSLKLSWETWAKLSAKTIFSMSPHKIKWSPVLAVSGDGVFQA